MIPSSMEILPSESEKLDKISESENQNFRALLTYLFMFGIRLKPDNLTSRIKLSGFFMKNT